MKIIISVDNNVDLGTQLGIGCQEFDDQDMPGWRVAVRSDSGCPTDVAQALRSLADKIEERHADR